MVRADVVESKKAYADLDAYARTSLVNARREFVCSRASSCSSSLASKTTPCTLVTGEAPFIGDRFSLRDDDGRVFRVVVVGKERGGDESNLTVDRRVDIIRAYIRRREETDHLKGTFLALSLLLNGEPSAGQIGTEVTIDGVPTHVSECFALVNSLACSAKPAMGKRGAQPTGTMKAQCGAHLARMLGILRPTVVIVQGGVAHDVLHRQLPGAPPVPTNSVVDLSIDGRRALCCSFPHPSPPGAYQWWSEYKPYFREVVRPTLRRTRELLLT